MASRTHGDSKRTAEYICWLRMKARCFDTKAKDYPRYGGRVITVCDRWRTSYENFLSDMGRKPSKGHSLERINNAGNYDPVNCRWATRVEQARNKRTNKPIVFNGQSLTAPEWAEITGINARTIWNRIHICKMSVEKALTTPSQRRPT